MFHAMRPLFHLILKLNITSPLFLRLGHGPISSRSSAYFVITSRYPPNQVNFCVYLPCLDRWDDISFRWWPHLIFGCTHCFSVSNWEDTICGKLQIEDSSFGKWGREISALGLPINRGGQKNSFAVGLFLCSVFPAQQPRHTAPPFWLSLRLTSTWSQSIARRLHLQTARS